MAHFASLNDVSSSVVVVGAGAAGLMAAGQAAASGAKVLVLEKMARPGRKLCITGKGRCNLTNIAPLPDFLAHFGSSAPFLRQAFHRFFTEDLLDFFQEQGLAVTVERGGRIFPASGKATQVLQVLERWLKRLRVELLTATAVEALLVTDGRIAGVRCQGRQIDCKALILSTGGASYPLTGSTGDGYRLAGQAGHHLIPIRPALVPLVTAEPFPPSVNGLQLRNAAARLFINGKKKGEAFGELTFMEFGLSGPIILTLSGRIVEALHSGADAVLALDLKPALDDAKLEARLLRDLAQRRDEPMQSVLRGLLPKELVPLALTASGCAAGQLAGDCRAAERKRLRRWLKDWRLPIIGHRPLAEAIVTAGGVDTAEINPRTMESRLVRGLYFAGEVLDIQADTGGYNLQAAFSTGWLAGRSAAASITAPREA